MKRLPFFIFLISLGIANLRADDQVSSVQQALKDQGFYYGQVDGQPGPETTAAIRRYQIRNGLHVDGALNKQTLDSLKVPGSGNAPAPAPTAKNAPLPPKPAPLDTDGQQPVQQQATPPSPPQDISQSDREFLRKQNGAVASSTPVPAPPVNSNDENTVPPPVVIPQQPQQPPLADDYASLFARTPYQNAPLQVQQDTLKTAQAVLARQTYYNGEVDGIPGPATAGAIVAFQNVSGLPQTGRLDLKTLMMLHLLPHQAPLQRRVIYQPFYPPPMYAQPRIYRGWAD